MRHFLLVASLLLSACSGVSREEALCRSHLQENLINPETAEFHDFSEDQLSRAPASTDELMRLPPKDFASVLVRDRLDKVAGGSAEGAKFYRVRLRAQGRLGNTITSQQLCRVPGPTDSCVCAEMPS
jgi:hypothetical protein